MAGQIDSLLLNCNPWALGLFSRWVQKPFRAIGLAFHIWRLCPKVCQLPVPVFSANSAYSVSSALNITVQSLIAETTEVRRVRREVITGTREWSLTTFRATDAFPTQASCAQLLNWVPALQHPSHLSCFAPTTPPRPVHFV